MYQPTTITVTDPRDFDGTPYDVACRAIAQCSGILEMYATALTGAFLMARNADMERNIAWGNPPAGSGYALSPEGRQFAKLVARSNESQRILETLQAAVAYDPKNPPKA